MLWTNFVYRYCKGGKGSGQPGNGRRLEVSVNYKFWRLLPQNGVKVPADQGQAKKKER
jgi:hypothetical protein